LSTTDASKTGKVTPGATGYQVTPFYKNISGQDRFVWDTPSSGPPVFPQTSGPVSFSVPYASGFGTQDGYLRAYAIVNSPATFGSVSVVSYPAGYVTPPTITSYTSGVPSSQKAYVISSGNNNLLPGTYITSVGSNSAAGKTNIAVTVPLPPPTITSLGGQDNGQKINVQWTVSAFALNTITQTFNIFNF
jgi:hypothetical protein